MQTLLPIIVGFILTGLIGNRLVQGWQARNWLLQQRFLGHEKEYTALKELADEIASLLGVRIYLMRRLNRALASGAPEKIATALKEYDDILKRWNERLTSFLIRLPMLADYSLALRLENSIQASLVKIGAALEALAIEQGSGAPVSSKSQYTQLEDALNGLHGHAITFNKCLLDLVHSRRADVYYGKRLKFSRENLAHFSTWQLVKALFVRDIDSLSIIRTPLDS